jgi:CubicO group peptidase (beta-lactamase class C family)
MRSPQSYISALILAIVLLGCHSETAQVTAHPASPFRDGTVKSAASPLVYDTSGEQIQELTHRLDGYYQSQVRAGFNGSVLIGYKGRVIYERYYGYSNYEAKMHLTPNSSCQLASVSKTFTAAAILYLYERKYLDINEKVQHYLSQFPYPDITVKMLLCHRSGLPDYTKWVPNYNKDFNTPVTNEDVMILMAKHKPALEFRPNSRFKYSNSNYMVLARIVEEVTEMNFPDFLDKYIFKPLGMEHSFIYDPVRGLPAGACISYKYNWRREPDMFADGVYGDKNLYSTVEDMYRWDQSFYDKKLLSNETIELAYGPCSFEKPGVKNYGLGWRMLCFPNGAKIIYHNGWWHGNNTSFYRFIQENLTIVVLGNKFNNAIYHQAPAIYSILKGSPEEKGFDSGE